MGDLARETMLGRQRDVLARLLNIGFVFHHKDLEPMLFKVTDARAHVPMHDGVVSNTTKSTTKSLA